MENSPDQRPAVLCEAHAMSFSYTGPDLLAGLSFRIGPGLTLVRGGDGRGKTTLLRLLAGTLEPTAGSLRRWASTCFHDSATDRADNDTVAATWLAQRESRHPGWQAETAARLIDGFGLAEHLPKPLYMLSTGSRRKVGLVAAAASGAALTLLETPFAALDAPSSRLLAEVLSEAANDTGRAWVLADYVLPPALESATVAGVIDLGD